jgi:hypothetical protein
VLISPNPAVPVQVDDTTGLVHLPIDQASGAAVVAEVTATGNLYQVPASKTFTGVAVLFIGQGVGSVSILDGSSNVVHEAAVTAVGVPANPYIISFSKAGGGGGNQLSVSASGGKLISAVVAGYIK